MYSMRKNRNFRSELRTCSAAEYQLQNILSMPIYAFHGAILRAFMQMQWMRIICEHAIACAIAYFAKIRTSHIFRIYKLRFQNRICGNYAAYAKIRISSHISAYAMPHILHICRIFQRIISPNSVYFPAYFASKRPAYFKKNFRFMVMCLVLFFTAGAKSDDPLSHTHYGATQNGLPKIRTGVQVLNRQVSEITQQHSYGR